MKPNTRRCGFFTAAWSVLALTLALAAQIPNALAMAYCVEPPGGVVAWWSANGHALDVMGGNHGQTPFGMVYRTNYVGNYDTNYVGGYGIISAAFEFDGISQRRVSIPDRPAFALSSFSIEATVEFRGSEGFIFFRGDNRAGYDAYTLTMTGPRTVQFSIGGADGNYASVQAFAPSNVLFYPGTQIAATFNSTNGEMRLYFDGSLVARTNTPIRPLLALDSTQEPAIGIGNHGGTFHHFPFNGIVDEVVLYNRALSEAEVYTWRYPTRCMRALPPVFTLQPTNVTLVAGSELRMAVAFENDTVMNRVQWRRNGEPLPGQTNRILRIQSAQATHAGTYSIFANNDFGSAVSSNATVTLLGNPGQCTNLPPGLIGWWAGEGDGAEKAGRNPALLYGPVGFMEGRVGRAFSFTNGAHAKISDSETIQFPTGLTLEAWVKPQQHKIQVILSKWNGSGTSGHRSFSFSLQPNGDAYLLLSNDGTTHSGIVYSTNTVPLNTWTHIAATYDGTNLCIYLNGVLQRSVQYTEGMAEGNSAIGIGGVVGLMAPGSALGTFEGLIDEPSVYRQALNPDQIRSIYMAGAAGKCGQAVAPIITRQPVSQQLSPGQTLRLEAEVVGTLPIQFQWYRNHERLVGATMPVLTISNVTSAIQGTYYLGATNLYGWAVSTNVQVTVAAGSAPTIVRHPISQTAGTGQTAFFSLEATGTGPLRYAWRKDGIYLLNATNSSLVISNLNYSDAGLYSARVTNLYGTVFSGSAYLTVTQSTFGCVQAPSGLVTWWRGELNAADQLGNLPSYSNTTKFALGKVGYAFNFDGAKDTVTNHMPRLTNVLDNYTYEFWAKPTAGRAVTPEMLEGLAGISGQRYAIFPFNGLQGAVGSGVSVGTNGVSVFEHGDTYLSSLLVYNATNWDWVHVAVVYSNRQPSLYLNGTPVRTGLRSTRSSSPSTFLGMNNAMPTDYGHYAGLLDEVSIYSRRLSSQEIHAIYTAGAAGKCVNVGGAPVLTQHPNSQQLLAGQTLFLSVAATGAQPLHYTWFRNDQAIQGGIDWPTLVISNVTVAHQGVYHVRVTNIFGAALSSNVLVTVSGGTPLEITRQPASSMVATGAMAFFDVAVRGTGPITYAWRKDGVPISYGTNPLLIITNVTPNDAGLYSVVVVSPVGTNVSDSALLTVYGHTCLEPAGGLITWWRGEFNGADNQNLVMLTPMNLGYEIAKVWNGFWFNGTNGVAVSGSPGLTNRAGNHTIEFWARPQRGAGNFIESTEGFPGYTSHFQPWAIFPDNGKVGMAGTGVAVGTNRVLVYEHFSTNLAPLLVWNGTLSSSAYTHVAVVYSNRQPSLYINGSLVRIGLQSPRTSYPSTQLGGPWNPSDPGVVNYGYYQGGLDEVSIYGRSLSSHEVQRVYLAGSAGKCPAILGTKPSITQQPLSQVVTQGQTATFTVGAAGTAPLYYQWTRNQSPMPGGTNAVLVLENAQPSQEGSYQVRVTNLYGLIWSTGVQLRVIPAPTPQLRIASVTNAVIGSAFYVPIEFTGRGVENAMSFSIAYPASRMRFDGLLSGDAASNATILTNTNLLSSGLLGVALAMPADRVFASGVAVWARFIAATNQLPGTANISFTSTPILMDMVDGAGNRVFPSYYGGTVTFSSGVEGDVAPIGNTDNVVRLQDWVLIGRMAVGKQTASPGLEFMKADCSPRATLGDGRLTVSDWVQAGRYVAGLDPSTPAGGPATNMPFVANARKSSVFPSSTIRATSAGLRPGTEGAVVTEVLARGGENALGFSLGFDPAALEYRSVAMASVVSGATLEVNAAQAAAGRLGIILALPTGRSFDAGSQQVLRLTFQAKAPQGTKTAINFTDEPVARELADVLAQPMDAVFVPGIVTVDPRPALTLEIRNDRVVLQWPAWASDCALEVTEDASLQHWGGAPANATVNQDACTLELPLSGKSQFFRLRQN